jgi:CheY-like chemotaxis protein
VLREGHIRVHVLSTGIQCHAEIERICDEPPTLKLLLLVEDNPALATRLGEMLVHQAYSQMIVASDCLTALKFLRSCTPDLMLVDQRLLTHNGIDLAPRFLIMKDLQDISLLLFSTDFS